MQQNNLSQLVKSMDCKFWGISSALNQGDSCMRQNQNVSMKGENSWKAYISVRSQSKSPQQHFKGNLVSVAAQPKTDMNSSD
jgi:hypothetical protein